jgi:hypothetical protein
MLLVGAVLLAESFLAVMRTPLGFHAENVLTMQVPLPRTTDENRERHARGIEQLAQRCSALPGVLGAAAVSTLPLWAQSKGEGRGTIAEENRHLPISRWTILRYRSITPAYFRTLGIALHRGREFTARRETEPGSVPAARVAVLELSPARR